MNEQLDHLIPASKISSLRSGQLVAQIAQESNNFDGKHILSTYNCKVDLNVKRIIEEEKKYKDLPKFYNFGTEKNKKKLLTKNMIRINNEIEDIINSYKQMA